MEILILDSDAAARKVYTGLIQSMFTSVTTLQTDTAAAALKRIAEARPDLVMIDFFSLDQPFDFMQKLTQDAVPFIVLAQNDDERMIVEVLKGGALDFVAKRNIKLGYLRQVIARALLEVPRWQAMQTALAKGPKYDQHAKYNQELQDFAIAATVDDSDESSGLNLVAGRAYHLVFQYCGVASPSVESMDDESRQNHMNLLLDRLGAAVSSNGGVVWTRKSNANISIFAKADLEKSLIAAIEGQSALIDLTSRMYGERPRALYAMTTGRIIYTHEKGELISEAINLSAHLVEKSPFTQGIVMTEDMYQKLSKRAQRYLLKVDEPFQDHVIYKFSYSQS